MIPAVFAQDCLWLLVVVWLAQYTQNRRMRALMGAMALYVACEALFHVQMERIAALLF